MTRGVLCAALCTAAAGTLAAPAAAATARTAVVVTGGSSLNVRGGPGTNYAVVRHAARNVIVTPLCQVKGQSVVGPVRTSAFWDQISGGGYVSDGFLRWRGSRPALPTCTVKSVPSVPTPPAKPMTHDEFMSAVGWPARMTARRYGVPASVTLAQAILESGWGASGLSTVDKNYFGIKCFNNNPGSIAIGCHVYNTHECGGGKCWPTTAAFRVYATLGQSIDDHGHFLVANERYKPAFQYSKQPDQFAAELKKAGYATSPTYAQNLVKLMAQYNLYRWDI